MEFDWQMMIAAGVAGGAAVYLGWRGWRVLSRSRSGSCGGCSACPAKPDQDKIPIVPLDGLWKPHSDTNDRDNAATHSGKHQDAEPR